MLNNDNKISMVGASPILTVTSIEAESIAVDLGFKMAKIWNLNIAIIFIDCIDVQHLFTQTRLDVPNNLKLNFATIKHDQDLRYIAVEVIPRDWNHLADKLTAHGRSRHDISLYHQGYDLSRWLMKEAKKLNYCFN